MLGEEVTSLGLRLIKGITHHTSFPPVLLGLDTVPRSKERDLRNLQSTQGWAVEVYRSH